jgi:hypothetical protein
MTAEGIGRGPRAAQPHAVVRILLRALLTAAPAPHSRSGSARGARSVWQRLQSRKRAEETYGVRLLGALLYGESRETHVCRLQHAGRALRERSA